MEPILEDFNLSCPSLEEEKGQKGSTIASTPSTQEGLQENSIFGVENQSYGHIKWIRPCPIRYLASLEPKEKPQPVMLASKHEDELQSSKDQLSYLSNPNAEQLKEVLDFSVDTLTIWIEDQLLVDFPSIQSAMFNAKSIAWLPLLRKGSYFSQPIAGFV